MCIYALGKSYLTVTGGSDQLIYSDNCLLCYVKIEGTARYVNNMLVLPASEMKEKTKVQLQLAVVYITHANFLPRTSVYVGAVQHAGRFIGCQDRCIFQ